MVWHMLFRTKRLETSPADILSTKLRRCLSTWDLIFIGIGSTLGSSVYVITGEVSQSIAGPSILISFVLAAVASILSGMCYSEFAARVPKAGSAYVYSYTVMGEVFAFVVGWNLILEYSIGAATVVRGLSTYLDSVSGEFIKDTTMRLIGEVHIHGVAHYMDVFSLVFTLLCTIVLSFGVENSSILNNVCTIINVIVIVMIVAMGSFYAESKNLSNFIPFGLNGIISGGSSCFFAFIGFDAICAISEEAKNPSRSIPISIVATIGFCFVAYFTTALILNMMISFKELHGAAALSHAFERVGNKPAKYIIGVGAIFGLTGCSIVSLMMMPRFLYSMAMDGLIFGIFAKVNQWSSVPVYSTIFSGLLTGLMAMIFDLTALVEMCSIGTLLAYSLVTISVTLLRYKETSVGLVLEDSEATVTLNQDAFEQLEAEKVSMRSDASLASTDKLALPQRATSPFLTWRMHSSPRKSTERTVTLCVLLIVLEMFAFCGLLTFCQKEIFQLKLKFTIPFILFGFAILVTTAFISRMPQKSQRLYYKVPGLPWVPVLALFFNVYLMYGLKKLTWIRFGGWMGIGTLIYAFYGVWHSKERVRVDNISTPD